jgi:hypothetical protein
LNPGDFASAHISLSVEHFAILNAQRMQNLKGQGPMQVNDLAFESNSSIKKITLSTDVRSSR